MMKKFKRIAALLLAGLMMLAMFTACSEEDVDQLSLGKRYVQAYVEGINRVRSEGLPTLENDSNLQAYCKKALEQIDADGCFDADLTDNSYFRDGIQLVIEIDSDGEAPEGKYKALALTDKSVAVISAQFGDASGNFYAGWDDVTALGVYYLEVDGALYGAYATSYASLS